MTDLITIQQAVDNFKTLIEDAIIEGGMKGKAEIIRSSQPINNIHDAVKSDFIKKGIARERIHPPLGASKPELKLAGFIKQKRQDVCITPEGFVTNSEILTDGILREATDYYGKDYTERTISINIRSQISSLAKNFDTLYERTIAEAQNLHVRCPKMVLGEVYMIPVKEYDAVAIGNHSIDFIDKIGAVEKYIKSFQAINGRHDYTRDEYKYERVCLLLVDFQQTPAKIYNSNKDLHDDGLLDSKSDAYIDDLSWENFTDNILTTYNTRFGSSIDN